MGCGGSKAAIDEHKAALASAEFSGSLSWSGLAPITGTLNAVKAGKTSEVKDTSGAVLLKAENGGPGGVGSHTIITDAATGSAVVLIVNTQMGNYFTRAPTLWSVYTATATSEGQQPEATPTGAQMYKHGTFSSDFGKEGNVYKDANGATVLVVKRFAGEMNVLLTGPDKATAAAVVEGVPYAGEFVGTCTFAKGVDPIMAIGLATAMKSVSG